MGCGSGDGSLDMICYDWRFSALIQLIVLSQLLNIVMQYCFLLDVFQTTLKLTLIMTGHLLLLW